MLHLEVNEGIDPLDVLRAVITTIVPITLSKQQFQFNNSFAAAPGPEALEPIWDGLIPSTLALLAYSPILLVNEHMLTIAYSADGLGYVANTTLNSETSMLSVFHQLHCLVS